MVVEVNGLAAHPSVDIDGDGESDYSFSLRGVNLGDEIDMEIGNQIRFRADGLLAIPLDESEGGDPATVVAPPGLELRPAPSWIESLSLSESPPITWHHWTVLCYRPLGPEEEWRFLGNWAAPQAVYFGILSYREGANDDRRILDDERRFGWVHLSVRSVPGEYGPTVAIDILDHALGAWGQPVRVGEHP